jgi:hypothetical protein
MDKFTMWFWQAYYAVLPRQRRALGDEVGDVPGWVMITVMTAGLVGALTLVAGPRLQQMLIDALNSVGG